MTSDAVPLREYVERVFAEKQQAMVVAEQEREKTHHVAEQEREKAAQARKAEFDNRIIEVDRHLRQHINTQIDQVNSDRAASVKLLETMITGVRKEMLLIHTASEEAIKKAEASDNAWRKQANEWRGQSADRERSQQQTITELTLTFLRQETFTTTVDAWSDWRATHETRVSSIEQRLIEMAASGTADRRAVERTQDRLQPWMLWAMGAMLAVAVFAANLLTG